MNAIELIGFVFSMLALIVLTIQRVLEERRRRQNPEAYEREQQEQAEKLRAFLKGVNDDMDDGFEVYPPKQQPKKVKTKKLRKEPKEPSSLASAQKSNGQFAFSSSLEERHLQSKVEERRLRSSLDNQYGKPITLGNLNPAAESDAYAIGQAGEHNRVQDLLVSIGNKQDMIILSEILGPPKAFKTESYLHP